MTPLNRQDFSFYVSVDNGKYTFVKKFPDSKLEILRYGETWVTPNMDFPGVNAFMAAIYELDEYKERG